jgi:phosphoribosylamine--glycine ligase
MKVLLVGAGGREHALAWKIAQSPLLTQLAMAPGNPGMVELGETHAIASTDVEGLVALAQSLDIDLVVVGPESALEAGLADRLEKVGIACFGHSAAAARIETSKAFSKDFAARHGLPTARHGTFEAAAPAKAFLGEFTAPYVIKADGLAAGKGVVIAETLPEAEAAIDDMLGGRFGAAGARVVIEEFMAGEEASLFALSDGKTALLFGAAQDHKRAYDGDLGPNTGGMGTYSPPPVLTPELVEQAQARLIQPTVRGMAEEGSALKGVLYAGLMLTDEGPKLVEYNCRFGDPECQVLMLRLESDLLPYLHACATGRLAEMAEPEWRDEAAVCVVLAARGYPDNPEQGAPIKGAEADFGPDVVVFHAGTSRDAEGRLVASGGRVLNVCARGRTVEEARKRAYEAVDQIDFPGGFHRRDIAWRALKPRT